MGTRSIIAIPDNDTYKGRYCHWDGYPSHMGHALCAIVNRDGIKRARQVLTADTYGWSIISPGTPSIVGVTPDPDAPWGSAEKLASEYDPSERFRVVAGYGTAYSPAEVDPGWLGPETDAWQEWIYVLRDEGLEVLDASGFSYGVFAYDDAGANFAACEDRNDKEVA
jgi:hypothetical protein